MNNEEMMREMMVASKNHDKFYFYGAGPSYTLTKYGAAKFMEQAAVDGICEQLEEYGHEQYWVHNRNGHGDYIFTICPEGKSVPRCIENLREQKYLNLTTIVLTTSGYCDEMKDLATYVIATPEPVDEDYYWFVAGNVFARLANFYTEAIGLSEKKFGTDEQFAEHYRTIHFSRFCPEVAEYDIPCPDEETIRNVGALGLSFEKKK
jgi:glutamine---fructose-6-phosphate transaminase (isomerizing)